MWFSSERALSVTVRWLASLVRDPAADDPASVGYYLGGLVKVLLGLPPDLVPAIATALPLTADSVTKFARRTPGLSRENVREIADAVSVIQQSTGFDLRAWPHLVRVTSGDLHLTTLGVTSGVAADDLTPRGTTQSPDEKQLEAQAAARGFVVPAESPPRQQPRRMRVGFHRVRYTV